jgi:glycosyltransferase involved in cell wall biosynthesis
MRKRKIASILHHPLPLAGNRIYEELGYGWHFRTAKALAKYGGFLTVAARPNNFNKWDLKVVNNVVVILAPALSVSPSERIWKWSDVSLPLAGFVRNFVKHDFVPYIHEYRTLNSEMILRKIIDYNVILQHHGTLPPTKIIFDDPLRTLKELNKLRRDLYLRKVKGAVFVLNKYEEFYLREVLNVEAEVKIRTMAIDFNELKPLSEKEKIGVRKSIGVESDEILLTTYVGVFREEFGEIKGAHHVFRIWREVKKHFANKVKMIVTGIGEPYLSLLRKAGVMAYRFLPYKDFTKITGASDAYFLPATSGYKYGGIGVAVMEAMALGVPVVSPKLKEFPEPSYVKEIGASTNYVDDENSLKEFIDALTYVIENREHYKPSVIRELGRRYYSWESFVRDFDDVARKL